MTRHQRIRAWIWRQSDAHPFRFVAACYAAGAVAALLGVGLAAWWLP